MNGMHNADMGGMMQGPWHGAVMAVMAAGAGLSLLLWLVLIALGGLAIVWLVRRLRSNPEPPDGSAAAARS